MSSGFFSRFWTFCVFFFVFIRVGEATVPGPRAMSPDSFFDAPVWTLPGQPDFCIGVGNPSGINNKLHTLDFFPKGWFHLAETQASRAQQSLVQSHLRAVSARQQRNLRCCVGAPAPLRPGSQHAGSWTGVMNFADCHLRQVPSFWPSGEYSSGRVMMTVAHVGHLQISAATVYCPAHGPSFPQATELAESLLEPITEALVFGRAGARIICGDFNAPAGSLRQMNIWRSQGWVELQELMHGLHSVTPRPTCKSSTAPDQLWCSPEIVHLISNIALWQIYPDHDMLLAGIHLPNLPRDTLQWHLPGHIPWNHLSQDLWTSNSDVGSVFPSNVWPAGGLPLSESDVSDGLRGLDSTSAFQAWSGRFEKAASSCMVHPTAKADRSYYGRGQMTKPKLRRSVYAVPKHSRQGEVQQTCGFLNRAVARWFKQLRRLLSYVHAVRSANSSSNFMSRAALWHSILKAAGFEKGFESWWKDRPVQLQGTPNAIPRYPPDEVIASLLYDDFCHNYRQFESWQLQRRRSSCQAKMLSTTRGLFAVTKKPAKDTLDCLEDRFAQPIQVIDAQAGIVQVPDAFPSENITHWTLQDQPAIVRPLAEGYQVDTDYLLVNDQVLTCHIAVHDTATIHNRLIDLWSPRWNKHKEVPAQHWNQICAFARAHIQHESFELPAITAQDFRRAVGLFKATAATGPCGWSLQDLKHMTDEHVAAVVDFYAAIEAGVPWPSQWCVGLIHCLQKRASSSTVDGFRPITVASLFYRIYAGIRSGQILAQLSKRADRFQTGFIQGRQASDVWYLIGISLELAMQQSTPLFGAVADIVKAYNSIPRTPTFEFLRLLGTPEWFLRVWASHLQNFTRFFIVHNEASPEVLACTGYPEGCPLACAAMTAIDTVWHWWQHAHVPRPVCLSYVDNLEILGDTSQSVHTALQSLRTFCSHLDFDLDSSALYTWSSCSSGRKELRTMGYNVSLGARDLGGQVTYCRQLRNRVLVDRIESVKPYFAKLRCSKLPVQARILNLKQVIWPRALHGCEAVVLGETHINSMRSGAMKATRWNRGGASPLVHFGLLHTQADPAWYQVWRVFQTFRRQYASNPVVADFWKIFAEAAPGGSHGPFGKLLDVTNSLGMQVDENACLWFSQRGFVDLVTCSDALLTRVLVHNFHRKIAGQVRSRAGFEDLEGFDYDLTTCCDSLFLPSQVEQLMVVRDGSFFTNQYCGKFDARKTEYCISCGVLDSRAHRYTVCSRYDHIRAQHQQLFAIWDELPVCFQQQGLVPANPWRELLWEAFQALPSLVQTYELRPSGKTWHLFTDGTCSSPQDSEVSLAAWAVVWADHGTIACGYLSGIQQTITRAEITAVLSALGWATDDEGVLHLWIDSQSVVDHLRDLLRGTGVSSTFEHADLWKQISNLLQVVRAEIVPHKVVSHLAASECIGPLEDWTRRWNAAADTQADLANLTRPPFFEKVWTRFQQFRRTWQFRVQLMTQFQVEVASQDCTDESPELEVEAAGLEVSHFDFVRCQNTADVSVYLSTWLDMSGSFQSNLGSHAEQILLQLCQWLIEVDSSASEMRLVSWVEIYVAFRIHCGGGPLSVASGEVDRYSLVTLARDMSFFRKLLKCLITILESLGRRDSAT